MACVQSQRGPPQDIITGQGRRQAAHLGAGQQGQGQGALLHSRLQAPLRLLKLPAQCAGNPEVNCTPTTPSALQCT